MRLSARLLKKPFVSFAKLAGVVAVLSIIAVGCGGEESSSGADLSDASFSVGSKDFTEQLVLGQITVAALEAAGANVDDQVGLAGTNAARQALLNGDIDMYWEYTGTIWINFLGNTNPIADPQEQYQKSKQADQKQNNLTLLDAAPANNTYALAIRDKKAKELGVEKLSDLGPLIKNKPDEATLCVESEFRSRDDGLPGMEKKYGYQFPNGNVSLFDTGVVYQRTDKGNPCNFGEVFITDGRIAALGLTVLEDDKNFFPIYNPALEMRQETFDQYGDQLGKVFNPIAAKLTNKTMQKLNGRVDVDGELPEDVAQEWLENNGFIE